MPSSAGYAPIELPGLAGGTVWTPVPADYDGDGLADPAVRSHNGAEWTFLYSGGLPFQPGTAYMPVTLHLGLQEPGPPRASGRLLARRPPGGGLLHSHPACLRPVGARPLPGDAQVRRPSDQDAAVAAW